jgi:dipeptidyl aminopeptidase/acylaminoacyl peptidase
MKLVGGYMGLLAAMHVPSFRIKYSEAAEMFRIIF